MQSLVFQAEFTTIKLDVVDGNLKYIKLINYCERWLVGS